jgi:CubicO group peptidase (beta-lactamase class C family)
MRYLYLIICLLSLNSELFAQTASLQHFISDYANEHQFNGTILVKEDSKLLYHQSFGIADRRFNIPIVNETEYKVASITKAFTAVLILQLSQEGKLDLNRTIKTYLPDYKGEAGTKVTIHQLLNHTSGMRNLDTLHSISSALKNGLGYYQKFYTPDQIVNDFYSDSLVNIPGEKFDYNNGEYVILGKIIEAIDKKSYEEVLKDRILKPLEMNNTGLLSHQDIVPNLSSTYFFRKDINRLVSDLPYFIDDYYAAGAMYSNASDLIRFSDALFGLKLINKQMLGLMINPGLDDYGYGVWIRDIKGANDKYARVERYGSIMGVNVLLMHFLKKNVTVIMLSNTNLTDLGDYALKVGKEVIH